jgi:hypothetical protein
MLVKANLVPQIIHKGTLTLVQGHAQYVTLNLNQIKASFLNVYAANNEQDRKYLWCSISQSISQADCCST